VKVDITVNTECEPIAVSVSLATSPVDFILTLKCEVFILKLQVSSVNDSHADFNPSSVFS
jgi:hypothetical protein